MWQLKLNENTFLQIGYTVVKQMFEDVYKIIDKSFVEHQETFDADNLRDFMDVFIMQMNIAKEVSLIQFQCQIFITSN